MIWWRLKNEIKKGLCQDMTGCEHCVGEQAVMIWIKDFFNIQEKDLE